MQDLKMGIVCFDHDGTLTDHKFAQCAIEVLRKRDSGANIKVGIVTARSIGDDFVTPGQLHTDIKRTLESHNLQVDFICTRYALYLINRRDYAYGIDYALLHAEIHPVFGEQYVDYLEYRSLNQELIKKIASGIVPTNRLREQSSIKILMLQERNLFDKYVQPYLRMGTTAKVPQIEQLGKYYAPDKHIEAILIDDAIKHTIAVSEYIPSEHVSMRGISTWAPNAVEDTLEFVSDLKFMLSKEPADINEEDTKLKLARPFFRKNSDSNLNNEEQTVIHYTKSIF